MGIFDCFFIDCHFLGVIHNSLVYLITFYVFTEGAFSGEDVTHVEGEVDPVRDLGIISEELRQKVRVNHNL